MYVRVCRLVHAFATDGITLTQYVYFSSFAVGRQREQGVARERWERRGNCVRTILPISTCIYIYEQVSLKFSISWLLPMLHVIPLLMHTTLPFRASLERKCSCRLHNKVKVYMWSKSLRVRAYAIVMYMWYPCLEIKFYSGLVKFRYCGLKFNKILLVAICWNKAW